MTIRIFLYVAKNFRQDGHVRIQYFRGPVLRHVEHATFQLSKNLKHIYSFDHLFVHVYMYLFMHLL